MKARMLMALISAVLVAPFASAAAPDKLDGFTYYERGAYPGAFVAFEDSATQFTANGTFTQIYARRNLGSRDALNASFVSPDRGSYSYRKIDDRTAELSFYDAASFAHTGTLRFDSDSSDTGIFDDPAIVLTPVVPPSGIVPVTVISRTFRLVPPSVRAPLTNASNRSFVRAGGSSFTGFVIAGTLNRMVLIRAVGPSLAQFGVANVLPRPILQGISGATNDRAFAPGAECVRRTAAALGAFPLPDGSSDFVLLRNLRPGAYSIQASSANLTDTGEVLLEVYILP